MHFGVGQPWQATDTHVEFTSKWFKRTLEKTNKSGESATIVPQEGSVLRNGIRER